MLKSLTASALVACALSATAASAADIRDPAAARAAVSRVELRDAQTVDKAYARLRRAAFEACDSNSIVRSIREQDRACAAQALNIKVAELAQPLLTARHESAAGTMFARGY